MLLVDDSEVNLMVGKVFLENSGLVVRAARDGREAVAMAAAGRVDAILMDVQMPEMDGLEATRAIRALPGGETIPIIAMTAAAMDEDRRTCLAAGMNDHVSKPIAPAEVLAVLAKWVGTGAVRPLAVSPAAGGAGTIGLCLSDGELPDTLPGFDLPGVLARLGTDRARLAAALVRFAADFARTPGEVARLVAEGNRVEASRLAHRAKGAAGNVGAVDVAQSAARLEEDLRGTADVAALPAFVLALQSAIDNVKASVRPAAVQGTPGIGNTALESAVAQLAKILDEHDLVPDALLAIICHEAAALGVGRLADALRAEVQSYDYARALQTLAAIARLLGPSVAGRRP